MISRKTLSIIFGAVSIGLIVYFFSIKQFKVEFQMYFKPEFYLSFSIFIISVMLLDASISLYRNSERSNLALAIFGYTALLEILFDLIGVTPQNLPLFTYFLLLVCAIPCIWIAHTDTYETGKLSRLGLAISLAIGAIESLISIMV